MPPDVVVEIVSAHSRPKDAITKKADYERNSVAEFWLIDPQKDRLTFYRLQEGKFVAASASASEFASEALPGLVLDLNLIRHRFHHP